MGYVIAFVVIAWGFFLFVLPRIASTKHQASKRSLKEKLVEWTSETLGMDGYTERREIEKTVDLFIDIVLQNTPAFALERIDTLRSVDVLKVRKQELQDASNVLPLHTPEEVNAEELEQLYFKLQVLDVIAAHLMEQLPENELKTSATHRWEVLKLRTKPCQYYGGTFDYSGKTDYTLRSDGSGLKERRRIPTRVRLP